MWYDDMVTMSSRIKTMRQTLFDALLASGMTKFLSVRCHQVAKRIADTPGDWTHLIRQSGMFGFLGLSPSIVTELKGEYHSDEIVRPL
jgi:aspartate aminotransferase